MTRRSLLGGAAALGAAAVASSAALPRTWARATGLLPAAAADSGGKQLRVGYVLAHEQFRTPTLLANAERAERAGFDEVWTSDHFQPWQDNQGHAMFPWHTQALLSERTRRVRFGTGVTCPLYRHHPSQVAQAFASLGILAPGRVFLGVGTGEALNEKAATGRFDDYRERAARWIEAITLIRRLWTGERVTFTGRYYSTVEAKLYDLPEIPVPIYMAASGPHSAYLAGRYGDGWVTGAGDLKDPALRAAFRHGAEDSGRDPDSLPILVENFVVVGGAAAARTAGELWRFTVNPWGRLLYVPNPVRIVAMARRMFPLSKVIADWPKGEDAAPHVAAIRELHALGATDVFIHSGQPDQGRVVDFYGRHVLPKVLSAGRG